jgi:proline dehydrogenase
MSVARSLLLRASHSTWLADQLRRRGFVRRAVRRFMPGEELADALTAAATLGTSGIGTILTQLGENITSRAEADAVRDHYLDVLDQVHARKLPSQISVKLTQLGLDTGREACEARLRTLVARAAEHGAMLWIDMEDSSYTDVTLDTFKRMRAERASVGVALQAYLRRTPADLEALLPLAPTVRLVKGAYNEPASVAFPRKRDVDAQYYDLAGTLLAHTSRGARPVFGTHDLGLIARIRARAAELGSPPGSFEVHMLYGIRAFEQRALAAQGIPVRVLVSYGRAWFAWYMRRLAERPANVWFVLRSLA